MRCVRGIEAGNGRVALLLETTEGELALDLALPTVLALLRGLLGATIERWPDLGLRAAALEPEPVPYPAAAVRVRAIGGAEPVLTLHLRSPYAGPLLVQLSTRLARPLLGRLQRAMDWLEGTGRRRD